MADLQKLGRYELRRVLGKGAMGVVYEGFDPTLGRRVAVKTILRNAAIDEETERTYSERFAKEAKAVARLNHPNIVQVYDFGEEADVAYLVMEFIEGRELRSFFEAKEKFDTAEAVRIMGELLEALEFAHSAGVIHRDVKPANVMLDAERRVKLADFGVARVQDSDRSAAGTMVGTPAFMSPEQIQGHKIDRRTDIFSAGVVLYQLLTGDQPFTGEGAWTVARKIMQDEPPPPSTVVRTVSPAFDAVVSRALAKNVAHRFPGAREFAVALREALAGTVPVAEAAPKPKARSAPAASEAEVEFWRSIQSSDDPAEYEVYLEQFPEGTYAQLARIKLGKLQAVVAQRDQARREAEEKDRQAREARQRLEAEARAKREAEEKARQEAQARKEAEERARREALERARQESEDKARREAAEKAKKEADDRARREAQEKARREAEDKARREREEKARRDAEGKARRAAEQKASRAAAPEEPRRSRTMPAIAAGLALVIAAGAFLLLSRKPPVEQVKAPPRAEMSAAEVERIRREAEERVRKEFADKSAAEQAAAAKAAADKAVQEKQAALKAAAEKAEAEKKLAAEKAAAEKKLMAEKAATEKAAREKADAEKAAAARSVAERAAAEKALAEKQAAEKALAEKQAAERAAAEKAAAEKAAAQKAAAEKAAAERVAAERVGAEKQVAAPTLEALLERFMQRHGAARVVRNEPPETSSQGGGGSLPRGAIIYVNDGSCPRGQIKQVTGGFAYRNMPRSYVCVSLADDRVTADKPGAARATEQVAAAKPAAAEKAAVEKAGAAPGHDALLARFTQRHGSANVIGLEPPQALSQSGASLPFGAVVYVNDGSCPRGQIKRVTEGNPQRNTLRSHVCVSLSDDRVTADKPGTARAPEWAVAAAATGPEALTRFRERHGAASVADTEPPEIAGWQAATLAQGQVLYVNDGTCPRGQIKRVTGGNPTRNVLRAYACVSLADDRPTTDRPRGH